MKHLLNALQAEFLKTKRTLAFWLALYRACRGGELADVNRLRPA